MVLSALAARKARQRAEAQKSTRSRPSAGASDKHDETASSSTPSRSARGRASGKHAPAPYQDDDAPVVQVVIEPPTASQTASLLASVRKSAATPTKDISVDSPSSARRSRRLSAAQQHTDSIAATRPRRSSVASATASTPKSTERPATTTTPQTATPSRRGGKSAALTASSSSTPASSSKKRKSTRSSLQDEAEDELQQAVQDIIDELKLGKADDDVSEAEQPPRKKRAGRTQPSSPRSPPKPRKSDADQPESSKAAAARQSASKRTSTSAAATPAETTPAKTTPAKRTPKAKAQDAQPPSTKKGRRKAATKADDDSATKQRSLFSTTDETRVKAARRYFAGPASQSGRATVAPSAMPVEDEATGFLAFGDSDSEEDLATQDHDPESETDDSSDDDAQQQSEETEPAVALPKRSKQSASDREAKSNTTSSPKRLKKPKVSTHTDAMDVDLESVRDQAAPAPALTRDILLDAVPYSTFEAVLDGPTPNTLIRENKKRSKEALYFGLRQNETLSFIGIGLIETLRGCAQIGGAILSASDAGFRSAKIHAPICNALPVLRCVSASLFPGHEATRATVPQGRDGHDAEAAPLFAQPFDTIIKVTPLTSPITAIGQVCPIGGLATPFSAPSSLELSSLHQLATLKVLLAPDVAQLAQKQKRLAPNGAFPTAGLSATYIPHTWQNALHRLATSAVSAAQHPQEESVVTLIRGSRKVGKSTFSRMALERILSLGTTIGCAVAYLELDLGQSDFGPPGMVALHVLRLQDTSLTDEDETETAHEHGTSARPSSQANENGDQQVVRSSCVTLGPGWCQPRVPIRAHFVGDVSPRDDPESYVAAVHDLIEFFRTKIQPGQADASGIQQRVPLVINTQGWIKGLGADLAARIEPLLRPTHIFDVIPRGGPQAVPAPTRGAPWLDVNGAILGAGPEIITLESVSQLEFAHGSFGQPHMGEGGQGANTRSSKETGLGDGGAVPPRYVTDVAAKLGPAEARLLNMMSYLYAEGLAPARADGKTAVGGTWNFAEPLVHRHPLVVDVEHGLKAGIRVLALGSSVPDNLKLMAINASIVAITVVENCDDTDATNDEEGSVWQQAFNRAARLAHSSRGSSTRCVGLAIVRSIDVAAGQVHLLTPLDPAFLNELQGGFGAIKGALELPVWASLDFDAIREARESRLDVPPAHARTEAENDESREDQALLAGMPRNQVPYLEWPYSAKQTAHTKLGSEKRRVRRNLMRKSQFA